VRTSCRSATSRDEQRLSFVATELNDGSARPTGIRDRGKEISIVPVLGVFTTHDATLASTAWADAMPIRAY
jgi:hypothetical protein